MDQHVNELTTLLEEEAEFYQRIESVLIREKKAVINASADALDRVRHEKERLLAALARREIMRQALVGKLAVALEKEAGKMTLASLERAVPEPASRRLGRCRQRLKARLERVQRLNTEIRGLLAHGLRLVQGTIALVNQVVHPEPVYRRSGTFARDPRNGRIISGSI